MEILAVRYLRIILKAVDRVCFAVFVFGGTSIITGLVLDSTPLEFLLETGLYSLSVGISVFGGFLALPVATLVFIFNTTMWFVGKTPWYWQSLSPVNFSFVLLTMAVVGHDRSSYFFVPMILAACYFVIFWFISSSKLYGDKVFKNKAFIFSFLVLVYGSFVLAIVRIFDHDKNLDFLFAPMVLIACYFFVFGFPSSRKLHGDKVYIFSFLVLVFGSFVLAIAPAVNHDKNLDFLVPIVMETFAFAVAWLVSSRKLYENKVFVFSFLALIFGSCYFNFKVLNFPILLFWGSFLLFISIVAGSSLARGSIPIQQESIGKEARAT